MSDATGPIASMPGSHHNVPEGQTCDECGEPAVKRVQGETDSFGCEMMDFCQTCYDKWKLACEQDDTSSNGICDWCKSDSVDLLPYRDADEGRTGPVYLVCSKCRDRDHAKWAKEYEQ